MSPATELLNQVRENNWRYLTTFGREQLLKFAEIEAHPHQHWGQFSGDQQAKILDTCRLFEKFGKECEAMQ